MANPKFSEVSIGGNVVGPNLLTGANFLSPVWDALGALTSSTGEVGIMTWGDSVSTPKWQYITPLMQRLAGKRGIAFDAFGVTDGVDSSTDFTRWPFRLWILSGSGEFVGFSDFDNNGYLPVLCDELTVFYVKESGAGTVNVTADTNASGTYEALTGFTAIDTSNATTIGGFTKASIPRAAYRFRINWSSGTSRVLGIRARDTQTGGIMNIMLGYSGQNLSDMNDAPQAVTTPILQELNPTVECFEMKDPVAGWETELQSHYDNISNALPDMAWLLVGSNPVGGVDQSDADQVEMNAVTREIAATNNLAYYDGHTVFGSYETMDASGWILDGVHPTADAQQWAAVKLLHELQWLEHPKLLRSAARKWVQFVNAQPFEFENLGGQALLRLIGRKGFFNAYEITDQSRNILMQFTILPSGANEGAIQLAGVSQRIIHTPDNRIGIGVNPNSSFTGALRLNAFGDIVLQQPGCTLAIAEGANAAMGSATLVAGTVTVNSTAIQADSRIILQHGDTTSATALGTLVIGSQSVGSFRVDSLDSSKSIETGDESDVVWVIIQKAS